MFDAQKERERIRDLFSLYKEQDQEIEKKQLFEESIRFAQEEVIEFNHAFKDFLQKVQHLCVYQDVIQRPLESNVGRMTDELVRMISKNYSQEELEKMPKDTYDQVVKSQKTRVDLLKKVAKTYLVNKKVKSTKEGK